MVFKPHRLRILRNLNIIKRISVSNIMYFVSHICLQLLDASMKIRCKQLDTKRRAKMVY